MYRISSLFIFTSNISLKLLLLQLLLAVSMQYSYILNNRLNAIKCPLSSYSRIVHINKILNVQNKSLRNRISSLSSTLVDNTSANNNNNQFIDNEILSKYLEEIKSLRGTPELVDRLENLVARYPGIELNMELYRSLYSFPLDKFQEDGLEALMKGNNVVVSTPTGSG